ncbi:MAG TPA: AAA family ATPase [Bacillota bacterium]|nr:AAA family ATPase [Bacillota bacterium]
MAHTPTLYLMVGYPGAGKTTVSRYIQELTGAEHLWADHERNTMFQNPSHDHQENIELYTELNRRARDLLHEGKSVIFDTNFNFYKDRKRLRIMAAKEDADSVVVWVNTPIDVARERATQQAEGQETRVWGNMPLHRFERISQSLQPPEPAEQPITLDGRGLSREAVELALKLHRA